MLKPSAQKVQDALAAAGFTNQVIELPDSARTAAEAAAAIGCEVAEIVKSLVFRARTSGRGVMIFASGANRVDEKAAGAILGEPLERADPDFVRGQTGYAIGGVPPLGHASPLHCIVDEGLLAFARVWAAAGHPHAVFALTPAELVRMTNARVAAIAKR
ncbi:MAG: YbaK/EbsC family protein [Deltaproteobacteria bacterium]|nr:YbaK/EbsC family protein [Deltaproteobacteria bacterium]